MYLHDDLPPGSQLPLLEEADARQTYWGAPWDNASMSVCLLSWAMWNERHRLPIDNALCSPVLDAPEQAFMCCILKGNLRRGRDFQVPIGSN